MPDFIINYTIISICVCLIVKKKSEQKWNHSFLRENFIFVHFVSRHIHYLYFLIFFIFCLPILICWYMCFYVFVDFTCCRCCFLLLVLFDCVGKINKNTFDRLSCFRERERGREKHEKKKLYLSHSLNKSQHNNITFDNNIHGSDDNRSHDVCASGEHTGYIDTNACGPKSPT